MLAQERRNLILERLIEEKSVVVSELSQRFSVSEETIRRDLDKLERDGLAVKSYGGAVINENVSIDMPFSIRKKRNIAGKQRIAELAARLVENGDHLMLDASSTAVFIARALKDKQNLTIITNSIEILVELSDMPGWKVLVPGGCLMEGYLALIGPAVTESLLQYHVEKTFISCKGVSLEEGTTDSNADFAHAKRAMLRCAKDRYLAVDSSKLGRLAFANICALEDLDGVITDEQPPAEWLDYFTQHGIHCYYP